MSQNAPLLFFFKLAGGGSNPHHQLLELSHVHARKVGLIPILHQGSKCITAKHIRGVIHQRRSGREFRCDLQLEAVFSFTPSVCSLNIPLPRGRRQSRPCCPPRARACHRCRRFLQSWEPSLSAVLSRRTVVAVAVFVRVGRVPCRAVDRWNLTYGLTDVSTLRPLFFALIVHFLSWPTSLSRFRFHRHRTYDARDLDRRFLSQFSGRVQKETYKSGQDALCRLWLE